MSNIIDNTPVISGYKIKGYDLNFYCKITEWYINTPNYVCTMSFGTGMKKFCLTASYKYTDPYKIYIDSVQKDDLCNIDGQLTKYDEGIVKLVKISLWTMKLLYPHVTKYTLIDHSHIYCKKDSKEFKLSISYDYILKYNETWYQKKFNAELPGFIPIFENGKLIKTNAEPNSFMDLFYKSLKCLDEPSIPILMVSQTLPNILKYKEEYETTKTPREFISKLRKKFRDNYCFEVGKWLDDYMTLLQIRLAKDFWYISSSNINKVPNYKAIKLNNINAKRILNNMYTRGGTRKLSKNVK